MKRHQVLSLLFMLLIRSLAVCQTAPVASDDSNIAELNTLLSVVAPGLLANDTDADGDVLTITSFLINGTVYSAGETANIAQGSITINADGSFSFLPATNFLGSFPTITYVISDGVNFDTALHFLTVQNTTNLNSPIATDDDHIAELNTTLSATAPGILANDTDADGDVLTVTYFSINGSTYPVGQTVNSTEGTITINADGSYIFLPSTAFLGSFPTIIYTISDGLNSDTAFLNLTVLNTTNLNPPIANTDVDTADIDTTLNVNAPGLLANDTDADGDILTCLLYTSDAADE